MTSAFDTPARRAKSPQVPAATTSPPPSPASPSPAPASKKTSWSVYACTKASRSALDRSSSAAVAGSSAAGRRERWLVPSRLSGRSGVERLDTSGAPELAVEGQELAVARVLRRRVGRVGRRRLLGRRLHGEPGGELAADQHHLLAAATGLSPLLVAGQRRDLERPRPRGGVRRRDVQAAGHRHALLVAGHAHLLPADGRRARRLQVAR